MSSKIIPGKGLLVPKRGAAPQKDKTEELERFAHDVIAHMHDDAVLPIPPNYRLFFDAMLDEQPDEFKKFVTSCSDDSDDLSDYSRELDRHFRTSIAQTKEILHHVAALYRQAHAAGEKAKSRLEIARGSKDSDHSEAITRQLIEDWEKFVDFFKTEALKLNDLYAHNVHMLRQAEKESIYDPRYNTFNLRYLLKQIAGESDKIAQFGHQSTFLALALTRERTAEIGNERSVALANRTIAKLLLKTSRRSDIIGSLGNGVFGLLLRHTSTEAAVKTAERITGMLLESNFFLGETQVTLQIASGIAQLEAGTDPQTLISRAVEAMDACDVDTGAVCHIYTKE